MSTTDATHAAGIYHFGPLKCVRVEVRTRDACTGCVRDREAARVRLSKAKARRRRRVRVRRAAVEAATTVTRAAAAAPPVQASSAACSESPIRDRRRTRETHPGDGDRVPRWPHIGARSCMKSRANERASARAHGCSFLSPSPTLSRELALFLRLFPSVLPSCLLLLRRSLWVSVSNLESGGGGHSGLRDSVRTSALSDRPNSDTRPTSRSAAVSPNAFTPLSRPFSLRGTAYSADFHAAISRTRTHTHSALATFDDATTDVGGEARTIPGDSAAPTTRQIDTVLPFRRTHCSLVIALGALGTRESAPSPRQIAERALYAASYSSTPFTAVLYARPNREPSSRTTRGSTDFNAKDIYPFVTDFPYETHHINDRPPPITTYRHYHTPIFQDGDAPSSDRNTMRTNRETPALATRRSDQSPRPTFRRERRRSPANFRNLDSRDILAAILSFLSHDSAFRVGGDVWERTCSFVYFSSNIISPIFSYRFVAFRLNEIRKYGIPLPEGVL